MQIKITTGYREDQFVYIPLEEAHKAYWLFLNPEQRGVFSNMATLVGRDIHNIEFDYHTLMGWNPTHKLDNHDYNELRDKGYLEKGKKFMEQVKQVSVLANEQPHLLDKKISDVFAEMPAQMSLADRVRLERVDNRVGDLVDKLKAK